jgi:hypothetical protein
MVRAPSSAKLWLSLSAEPHEDEEISPPYQYDAQEGRNSGLHTFNGRYTARPGPRLCHRTLRHSKYSLSAHDAPIAGSAA